METEEKPESYQSQVTKHFKKNYLLHSIEGGVYMTGIAFIDPNTILPRIVQFFNGPDWLISLIPTMMYFGFGVPPLFTAHKVEKMGRVKSYLLGFGVFQRLPFLLAALGLFFLAGGYVTLLLGIIVLAPLFSGLAGGFCVTPWQELVAKTIPENRRSSLFAIRFIIFAISGIVAGGIITTLLNKFPGANGFGYLHLIASVFIFVSYLVLSLIREVEQPPRTNGNSVALKDNLQNMLKLIGQDRQLSNYLLTISTLNGIFIMSPFLAIIALKSLNRPDSFIGILITAQMIGAIVGNIFSGYLGDKLGGKSVMLFNRWIFIVLCIWASISISEQSVIAIFFLFGAAFYGNQVGTATLNLEISPYERRSTYLAIIAFFGSLSIPIFSIISILVWTFFQNFTILLFITIISLGLSIAFLLKIREPRRRTTRLSGRFRFRPRLFFLKNLAKAFHYNR
jgi:MFS family permease